MDKNNMAKPRLLVTTDIGGDPDDMQSMIRLMCYSNEFDIEGLIATSTGPNHDQRIHQELIKEVVEAYGQVRENLLIHKGGYPTEDYLQGIIKRGMEGFNQIGEGYDTEASDWIISCVDRADTRHLNIVIWGGAVDLAQAVWKVKNTRSTEQFDEFISRMFVYSITKQDGGVDWLLENAPGIFMVLSGDFTEGRKSTFRGMYLEGDEALTSPEWINGNVKTGHGPLGALYPMETWTNPNPHKCMKEGDTPSWFYFLSGIMGLSNPYQPDMGCWGGRFKAAFDRLWLDAEDTVDGVTNRRTTVWRWRPEFQNDWAARMDWCVRPYNEANHPPVAVVNGDLERTVAPGEIVKLDASGSTDPDGGKLSYEWMYYSEAGSYGSGLIIKNNTNISAYFIAPSVKTPVTIHIILKVKDDGMPSLTGYKRVVVTVDPGLSSTISKEEWFDGY